MDKNASADRGLWGALEAMIVGFVIAGAAAAVLLTNFNGQGRLWDKLLGRADEFPPSPIAGVVRVTPPDPGSGHILLALDAPAPAAASAAKASTKPAPAPVKKSWIRHLTGELAEYSITGPASQHSSASASATDAPSSAGSAAPSAPDAALASARTPAPAAAPVPSYVNYGNTTRSDIMSSASGPVYNFKKK